MPPPSGTAGGLVLEQVPAIRDAILRSGGDWKAVARKMKTSVFAGDDAKDPDLKRGVGVGIRWYSIAGPIRVDVAQALDYTGDPWRVHFTIGVPLL